MVVTLSRSSQHLLQLVGCGLRYRFRHYQAQVRRRCCRCRRWFLVRDQISHILGIDLRCEVVINFAQQSTAPSRRTMEFQSTAGLSPDRSLQRQRGLIHDAQVSIHSRAFTRPKRQNARETSACADVSIHGRAFTRPKRHAVRCARDTTGVSIHTRDFTRPKQSAHLTMWGRQRFQSTAGLSPGRSPCRRASYHSSGCFNPQPGSHPAEASRRGRQCSSLLGFNPQPGSHPAEAPVPILVNLRLLVSIHSRAFTRPKRGARNW